MKAVREPILVGELTYIGHGCDQYRFVPLPSRRI